MTTLQELEDHFSQSFHITGRADLPICGNCQLIPFCTLAKIMPDTRDCHEVQRQEPKQVTQKGQKRTPRQR